MAYERDFTNDWEDWLINNPPVEQGEPEPPTGAVAPPPAVTSGPPYTTANPPPAPPDGYEYILNPNTGEFELHPRGGVNPPTTAPPTTEPPTTTEPYPTPGPTTYGDPTAGGGALAQYDSTGFEWPTYTAPAYQSAGTFTPRQATFAPSRPTFDYDPFTAPTAEQARNNPGYQAAATEARKQLEAGAAYRGTLRSGMTLGDILKQQTALGDQNYDRVYGRELDTYKTNRGNAYENWMGSLNSEKMAFDTNYGIDRDIFDRGADDTYRGNDYRFNASQAEFAPKQRKAELTFADLYSRWRDLLNSTTQIATAGD